MLYQTPRCVVCHSYSEIKLDNEKFARWQGGELIQRVWPEKTPDERELIMTGTHPECWEQMFGSDDEEEE